MFSDDRGFFMETYNRKALKQRTGLDVDFVQDNHSKSKHGVVRGLHYQIGQAQGKLVRVVSGQIFDVAVDLRRSSPTFKRWNGQILSAENKKSFWIPPGFAHGFLTLSPSAEVVYKTTDYYAPSQERCLLWNDPELAIAWPNVHQIRLSARDLAGAPLNQIETFE